MDVGTKMSGDLKEMSHSALVDGSPVSVIMSFSRTGETAALRGYENLPKKPSCTESFTPMPSLVRP